MLLNEEFHGNRDMNSIYPFIPLVLISTLTILFFKVLPPLRAAWVITGVLTVLCCLADWWLLSRLPKLGMTYGPVAPSLFILNFIRLSITLIALTLLAATRMPGQRIIVAGATVLLEIGILALAYDIFYIEPFRLTVSDVVVNGAPEFIPGRSLRILQLSDMHVEHIGPREREMMQKVDELAPDMIVLTGDYINKSFRTDATTLQETRSLLAQLHAPYGVFAINGNVDTGDIIPTLFDGLDNIHYLNNEITEVEFPGGTLTIAGVTTVRVRRDYIQMESVLSQLPEDAYTLLLYHYPQGVQTAMKYNVQIQLSGDTHGGQIVVPIIGRAMMKVVVNNYLSGRFQVGPTTLYVSRGIGMQGGNWPRIRFNCPPEMVLLEVEK
jgi:uncharacterized protein